MLLQLFTNWRVALLTVRFKIVLKNRWQMEGTLQFMFPIEFDGLQIPLTKVITILEHLPYSLKTS